MSGPQANTAIIGINKNGALRGVQTPLKNLFISIPLPLIGEGVRG